MLCHYWVRIARAATAFGQKTKCFGKRVPFSRWDKTALNQLSHPFQEILFHIKNRNHDVNFWVFVTPFMFPDWIFFHVSAALNIIVYLIFHKGFADAAEEDINTPLIRNCIFQSSHSCCFFHDSAVLVFTGAGAQVDTFVAAIVSFETEDRQHCWSAGLSPRLVLFTNFHMPASVEETQSVPASPHVK